MTILAELQSTVEQVAEHVGRSLVGVGQRWGVGSGIVVAPRRVLTNAHNVREDQVTVTFSDGRTETARVSGIDIDGDLAVLDVDTGEVPAADWSPSPEVRLGSAVLALANPGGRGLRVTVGFVSGTERSFRGPRGRRISGSIEHTAPLLPGSSGGPIVDTDGRLLGINTNRLGEGFYLAMTADDSLRERIDALSRGETPARRRLGVAVAPPHVARRLRQAVGLPDADGLLVRTVDEGSAASAAGIQEGDLITEAGGRRVTDVDALHRALDAVAPGEALILTVLRGTDERMVSIRFGGDA